MAYTPQEWRNGDADTPLSADRLLHIEQGIEDAHDGIADKADASAIPDVTGLATKAEMTAGLAGKADTADIPDVSGLATKSEVTSALADKADAAHTHTIANVTGLQAAIDGKQAKGNYATASALADLVARVEALETAGEA